jgi:hypothetical protein
MEREERMNLLLLILGLVFGFFIALVMVAHLTLTHDYINGEWVDRMRIKYITGNVFPNQITVEFEDYDEKDLMNAIELLRKHQDVTITKAEEDGKKSTKE